MGYSNLALAIRSELSALIFAKSTRRKDVKGDQRSEPALDTEGIITASVEQTGLPTLPLKEDPINSLTKSVDDLEKTRQSTINLVVSS